MKTVLVITYNFPPDGGPAVQRVTKFVKYMNKFGYNAIILTSKHKKEIIDNSLINDIPQGTKIYCSIDLGDYCPGELRNKILKKLFVPDKQKFWEITALNIVRKIFEKEKIDIIFSTSPPHSVHLIAQKIKEIYNIPWVADFRDEWTKNPSFKDYHNKEKNKELEEKVIRYADHIITCTESAKNNFQTLYDLKKLSVITNGFDRDDFEDIKIKSNNNNEPLRITYFGRLNNLHSPATLLDAINELITNNLIESEGSSIIVEIIGNNKKDCLNNYGSIKNIVKFKEYLKHEECLKYANQSDILLLLATGMNNTEFFPAKVFEYINLRKPILSVLSKKGELSKFLENYGNSYIVYEGDKEQMKKNLLLLMKLKKENKLKLSDNLVFIQNYDRKNQTKKLVELFNNIINHE